VLQFIHLIPTKNPQVPVSDTKNPCLACKLHLTLDDGTRDISTTPSGDPETSWSLLGPGMEVGLTPNCMKCIHIFPLLIVGSIFFFFLPSKLDVQCMTIAKKEQKKKLFQNPFKLIFNKYNIQCKVCERHLNSYFYKKSKFYKV
jgi:hypothetical protein